MARNQHAQDHLIRKWQSQNSNKTILLFAFVNDTTFLLLFSRQKFLASQEATKLIIFKNQIVLSVVYVCVKSMC